jgi:hypothetical protein
MKKASGPKASSVSSKLGSYASAKRTIGKNQSGKATKPVGLVKATKSKKGI